MFRTSASYILIPNRKVKLNENMPLTSCALIIVFVGIFVCLVVGLKCRCSPRIDAKRESLNFRIMRLG